MSRPTRVLKALQDYNEPISAEDLIKLVQRPNEVWLKSDIHNCVYKLRKTGHVIKTSRKADKTGLYEFKPNECAPEPVKPPIVQTVRTPTRENPGITILERCYYLVQAGRSMSCVDIADFFHLNEPQAYDLIKKVTDKYPDCFKLTVRIEAI